MEPTLALIPRYTVFTTGKLLMIFSNITLPKVEGKFDEMMGIPRKPVEPVISNVLFL